MVGAKRTGSLAAMAAAALAAPVTLPHNGSAAAATNFATAPSDGVTLSNDALIRRAQYDPVRKKLIIRPVVKPRFLPPNPCRIKSSKTCKR